MPKPKLDACPFCGAEPSLIRAENVIRKQPSYLVKCENYDCPCRPSTWWYYTAAQAAYEWNRRVPANNGQSCKFSDKECMMYKPTTNGERENK